MPRDDLEVGIIFYSMTGNVLALSKAVAKGVEEVPGVKARLHPVRELMPMDLIRDDDVRQRVYEEKQQYEEAKVEHLVQYDGFMLGTPTRYGRLSAQLAQFLDQTGSVWQEGSAVGKPAGVYTSTSTVQGGQEATILTTWPTLAHLGMLPVGVPYTQMEISEMVPEGGSPYGAGSVSGPGADRGPTDRELMIARAHGRRVAELVKVIDRGLAAIQEEDVELLTGPR